MDFFFSPSTVIILNWADTAAFQEMLENLSSLREK